MKRMPEPRALMELLLNMSDEDLARGLTMRDCAVFRYV